jgi:hypothetical protein
MKKSGRKARFFHSLEFLRKHACVYAGIQLSFSHRSRVFATMTDSLDPLEIIWDALFSREPGRVRKMFYSLDPDSRQVVLEHLQRMASEEGWHPEQRLNAHFALETLKESNV